MRRWIFFALIAASCTKMPLFPGTPRYKTEVNGWGRPQKENDSSGDMPDGKHLYATAVCFAKDYDWQIDTVPATEAALILLKDGAEILRIPSGGCASPQRHRARDGHLWTDRSEGGRTVIGRDGMDYISWAGEECLKGFIVRDGNVFTLGQRTGGKGVCLRCNGGILFEDSSGTVLGDIDEAGWDGGALAFDGDELCFCYAVSVHIGSVLLQEYRFVKWRTVVQTIPSGATQVLYDWRSIDGVLYRSETRSGGGFCIVIGDDYYSINIKRTPHLCKLQPWRGSVMVTFCLENPYSFRVESIAGSIFLPSERFRVGEMYSDGNHLAYTETDVNGRVQRVSAPCYPDMSRFSEGDYHLMTPSCGSFKGGCLALALTNLSGDKHLLCVDDTVAELHFNGYLSSVIIE